MPTKCVFLLLKRLFYGVTIKEQSDAHFYKSNVSVSYDSFFTATSEISQINAQNLASMKALQNYCNVENKFVQRKRNDDYPQDFAAKIQKYDSINL